MSLSQPQPVTSLLSINSPSMPMQRSQHLSSRILQEVATLAQQSEEPGWAISDNADAKDEEKKELVVVDDDVTDDDEVICGDSDEEAWMEYHQEFNNNKKKNGSSIVALPSRKHRKEEQQANQQQQQIPALTPLKTPVFLPTAKSADAIVVMSEYEAKKSS